MEDKKKSPELRFAGFTQDWIPGKLGDLGDIKMCKRIFNNQTADKGDIPFYKIGTFGKKANAFISKELYKEFREKYSFPKKGDILISASGTIGRTVVYDGKPAYFQDSNIVWVNNDESKVLNEFLLYIYESISYESEGGTIQRLYNSIILKANFYYPSSKESQKLILDFFKNIDELITKHQKKQSRLITLKKSMLGKMFPKQGQTVPDIRFRGFKGYWKKSDLENLGDFFKGKGLSKNVVSSKGKYKCLLYGHLFTEYGMIITNVNFSTNAEFEPQVVSKAGDVFIPCSSTTPTGIEKATSIEYDGVIIGGDINVIRPNETILGSFLSINLNANGHEIIPLIKGITVRHLDIPDLKTVQVHFPESIKEQEKIITYFKKMDILINNHQKQLQKLNNFKQSLSERMFV